MRKIDLTTSAVSVLTMAAAALSSPASGQTAPASVEQNGDASASPDIVVTGSRIAQPGLVSASPIATVSPEAFKQNGSVTLEETLNRIPQLVPARGATSNDGLTGGITTLNLRGLGSNRTLILQDSRRLQAATSLGEVDINNIPSALIESVDIVTGGASAAYGSDAIAGVVNFKLNHTFKGLQLDAQNGISARGDGFQTQAALTGGLAFADNRGHAQLSVSYARRDGVSNAARDFSTIVRPSSSLTTGAYIANAGNLPSQAAANAVFGRYGIAAGNVPRTASLSFNTDGSLFSFQANAFNYRDQVPNLIVSPDRIRYNSSGVNGLITPYERIGGYGHVDYDVAAGVNVYGEFNFAHYTSQGRYAPGFMTVSVPVTNPFIPADLRTLLASRADPAANFNLTRRFAEVGFRIADTTTNTFQARLGAKGDIGVRDWTWDLYGSYGRSDQAERDSNGFSTSAVRALVNAADGGASLCGGGLNLFGAQANTACAAYIRRTTRRDSTSEQKVAEVTVQGSLFKLPAGDVRFAVGADYRSDSFDFKPDAALRSGDIASFQSGAIPPVTGTLNAKEAYSELLIPLLANLPAIHKLSVGLGYRYSDYSHAGGVHSYRAEGNWEVFDTLRLRGGYARAVRSPSIYELFSPTSSTSPTIGFAGAVGQGDPCDVRSAYRTGGSAASVRALCLAQGVPANIIDSYTFNSIQLTEGGLTGGNLNLKAEKADTFTGGMVLTPRFDAGWLSGLTLSADYYNINIRNAVATIDGTTAIKRCYNLEGTNPSYSTGNVYCGLFGRSAATGQIDSIALYNLNLGVVQTSGIDMAVNWTSRLGSIGRLRVNAAATRVLRYKVQTLPGETPTDYAGSAGFNATALPTWKANGNVAFTTGPATIGVQYRYVGPMIDASVVGTNDTTGAEIPSRSYFDLNLAINASDNMVFRLGVNNLTDKGPPTFASFDQSNTLPAVYDVLGRSFYVGVTTRF